MGIFEMLAVIMMAQFILCAGIISTVKLLRDILDELEGRRENGGKR